MTRKDIITNSGYWEEYANGWKYNKSTDAEIAKDILGVINEALNIADVVEPKGKLKCGNCGSIKLRKSLRNQKVYCLECKHSRAF